MSNKNYGIGKFVALFWNEGKEGKRGYYTVSVKKRYKNNYDEDIEQKLTLFADDAVRLHAELGRAINVLLHPREIIIQQEVPQDPVAQDPSDDIPF